MHSVYGVAGYGWCAPSAGTEYPPRGTDGVHHPHHHGGGNTLRRYGVSSGGTPSRTVGCRVRRGYPPQGTDGVYHPEYISIIIIMIIISIVRIRDPWDPGDPGIRRIPGILRIPDPGGGGPTPGAGYPRPDPVGQITSTLITRARAT